MATGKHNKIKLREVNRHLVCRLCRGYYVDATTIAECLHSFCRSCIIKYLEKNSFCPICEVQIHKTKPYLSLRLDKALQDVVYKVVPGLYHNEMRRRREFYSEQKEKLPYATPEQFGLEERIIFSPEDSISLSLEYLDSDYLEHDTVSSQSSDSADVQESLSQHLNLKLKANDKSSRRESQDTLEPSSYPKRYLQCPAVVNVGHLKKFVRMKHELHSKVQVDIIHKRVPLPDHYTLMDVAYIYTWKRSAPLRLFYQIYKTKKQKVVVGTSLPEAKNTEIHPPQDVNKEKSEVKDKVETISAVKNLPKVSKNISEALPEPVEKLTSDVQKSLSDVVALKAPNVNKSGPDNKTKEIAKPVANLNEETLKEEPSSDKDKTISPFQTKISDKIKLSDKTKQVDKVTLEIKSKTDKSGPSTSKVRKMSTEEDSKLNTSERLLLNPVSGQLESVPFEENSNSKVEKVEEKKDKTNSVKKEKESKKESTASVRKIKLSKNESEIVKKEKVNKKDSEDVRKEKVNKKEPEVAKKEKIIKKEPASAKKEKVAKKDSESERKVKEQKTEAENARKEKECKKESEQAKKEENEQKKEPEKSKKDKEEKKEPESAKKDEQESAKPQNESNAGGENVNKEKEQKSEPENSRKEKEPKKEEESEKKSNLNILKNFRKEKTAPKENKIELKTSSGSTLTITALPRTEKPPEAETSKGASEIKEENVYDFDKSSSPEKSDLFSKQSKHSRSKYLMEHRDKWLAKEAAGEWMTFQEYREMLLKENNATENVCTRAKRKSVPNLFRISPEESRRGANREYIGKSDETAKEKKSPSNVYNIHAKDEDKKTAASKSNINSPPRPIKIENKDGEYFIKQEKETSGKSPEPEKQKKEDKYSLYQKLAGNYQSKVEEANKKLKTDETTSKNFGAIDLTKGETNSKEKKNGSENVTEKSNNALAKPEAKTSLKMSLEPLLKVPQYTQNFKNLTAKDWPSATKNLSPSEITQAFLHLKHLDAINQFNPNAVLEQFAKKTGNLDLLYQQKIDFIRRLKRHQQAAEDIAPEKKLKLSPPLDKKYLPSPDIKEKGRPTSEEMAALKNAEDLKTISRIQDLLEIQRAVTQNFKMPPALLQFYSRPRPYPPPIPPTLTNSQSHPASHPKSQNLGSTSRSLALPMPNPALLDSPNYGHLLSAAGLHTEMSFHQTFKNYLRRQEENPQIPGLQPLKKLSKLKEESVKGISDKHHNSKGSATKQEPTEPLCTPET